MAKGENCAYGPTFAYRIKGDVAYGVPKSPPKKFVESRTTNTIGKLLHGHHVAHHMPFRQEKSHVLELIRI